MNKLNVKALAIAGGVTWGLGLLLLGVTGIFGWGAEAVSLLGSFYIGYSPSPAGAAIGAVWGLADGAIGGAVIALIYNWAAK